LGELRRIKYKKASRASGDDTIHGADTHEVNENPGHRPDKNLRGRDEER
jgi:hypothetical protein